MMRALMLALITVVCLAHPAVAGGQNPPPKAPAQEGFVPVDDLIKLGELVKDDVLSVKSNTFRMTVLAKAAASSHPVTIECVMRRDGAILEWSER